MFVVEPRMDGFEQFVREHEKALKRIAGHTRQEHTYHDVVNEAWLMADILSTRRGIAVDFYAPAFQELLLSHLYQHLVRYTDLNVRRAVRLDHSPGSGAESGEVHPLLNKLSCAEPNDPLALLLAAEERPATTTRANEQHSLASAYLTLLNHLGNRMHRVARHLLISRSYAYRRFASARLITLNQHALLLAPAASASALKPWRRERAVRIPRQLEFDFVARLIPCPHAEIPDAPASRFAQISRNAELMTSSA